MSQVAEGRRVAPDWVPAERRWLGLDKASLPPAGFVLAVAVLLAGILPVIARAIDWDDETRPGDRIAMGGGVSFAPPAGWELTSGFRAEPGRPDPVNPAVGGTAAVTNGTVTIEATSAAFEGSVEDLLDQVNRNTEAGDAAFRVSGGRSSVSTDGGLTGASESWTSAVTEGQLVAFTFPAGGGTLTRDFGLTITVSGPAGGLQEFGADIDAVLASVSQEGPE